MKKLTKTKIATEMLALSGWCKRVENASTNLAEMPGVNGYIKGLFVALGSAAAFILPANVLAKFVEIASQTESGAAAVTHALKEIAIYFGVFSESMIGGILTLLGLAAVGVIATGLLYLFANEAVKFYQKHKANFAIELLVSNVKCLKEDAIKYRNSPESVTFFDLTNMVSDIKSILSSFGITATMKENFEFDYVFNKTHEKLTGEHNLAGELAYNLLPRISKLRADKDIPAVQKDAFNQHNYRDFELELRDAGIINWQVGNVEIAERTAIYTHEIAHLRFN